MQTSGAGGADIDAELLSVKDLKVEFHTPAGILRAVDGISFSIRKGEVVGLVGESGSGKTVTALSVMGLLPSYARISGAIRLAGKDILNSSPEEMRAVRGKAIAMIYQDPLTSLNPVLRVGDQISEGIVAHGVLPKSEADREAVRLMKTVGIPDAEQRSRDYPHQFSGGMRQRVVVAMALACHPEVLVADEPTTMLDLITQDGILDLIRQLRNETGSTIFITHDLGIVAEVCDRVIIMYAGKIVETGDVHTVFKRHRHPYTHGLLESVPRIDASTRVLKAIEGALPNMIEPPSGCAFHPRCPYADSRCSQMDPRLLETESGHRVACIRAEEIHF